MPTVGKEMADKLKAMKGRYADDPPVLRIIEYTNFAGGTAYGIEYEQNLGAYYPSQYVINPRIYWAAKGYGE